jgi:hypothetical protein
MPSVTPNRLHICVSTRASVVGNFYATRPNRPAGLLHVAVLRSSQQRQSQQSVVLFAHTPPWLWSCVYTGVLLRSTVAWNLLLCFVSWWDRHRGLLRLRLYVLCIITSVDRIEFEVCRRC